MGFTVLIVLKEFQSDVWKVDLPGVLPVNEGSTYQSSSMSLLRKPVYSGPREKESKGTESRSGSHSKLTSRRSWVDINSVSPLG